MAMSSFSDKDLDFFINHNYNVLFEGQHGVGKTHIILDAFRRNKLRFAYFSGSTLDPWVDLVGVPRPQLDEESGQVYLDLVRPKLFVLGKVQAIFVDEYSRSHKKVRNAVMEMIQFGTINGFLLKDLRVVWAAINPHDDDVMNYDTDEIDPAQRDRFHIHITVPYKPSLAFFKDRFGESVANLAIEWWNELPKDVKNFVSPRRLEYALDMYQNGGDVNFVLPSESNPHRLIESLLDGPMVDRLMELAEAGDTARAKLEITKDPNMVDCLLANFNSMPDSFADFWLPLVPLDNLMSLVSSDDYALYYCVTHAVQIRSLAKIVTAVIRANDQSIDGWKVLFSLVCPIGKQKSPSIAEQIAQNPYKTFLIEQLNAVDFANLKFAVGTHGTIDLNSVPEVEGVLAGDYTVKDDNMSFLHLVHCFLNPPDHVAAFNSTSLKEVDGSGHSSRYRGTQPSNYDWYNLVMTQIYRMRGSYHRTVEVNGVSVNNLIPLFIKAVIFEICQKGGVCQMYNIANLLNSDVVDSGLSVIQTVSGGNFDSNVPHAPDSKIKTKSRGKAKIRRGRGGYKRK